MLWSSEKNLQKNDGLINDSDCMSVGNSSFESLFTVLLFQHL